MKNLPILFLALILASPNIAFASVKVEISGNGEGSNSSVNVNSSVQSSTNNTQKLNNQTDIRIETNGEVKEYHGSDENVHIESGNGNNSVSINNKTSSSNKPSSSPSASSSASPIATPSASPTPNRENESLNLFELIKKEIAELFKIFQ